jgi:hypothetical protein
LLLHAQVAQFKTTVLLMPNGSDRVTGAPLQPLQTDKAVADEEVLSLLATSLKSKKKAKKKKAKKGDDEDAQPADEAPELVDAQAS